MRLEFIWGPSSNNHVTFIYLGHLDCSCKINGCNTIQGALTLTLLVLVMDFVRQPCAIGQSLYTLLNFTWYFICVVCLCKQHLWKKNTASTNGQELFKWEWMQRKRVRDLISIRKSNKRNDTMVHLSLLYFISSDIFPALYNHNSNNSFW